MDTMKNTKLNHWKALFKKYYPCFLAGGFVLAVYLFYVIVAEIYPFGDKSVASFDLSAQICPFVEHLFDVMNGRSTLFYSNALGGGADVFGSLAYFIISPFSFLFLIWGEGMVAETVVIVLGLKIVLIAAMGAWFAVKMFSIEKPVCALLGVLYAFCGYTFVANTYINWLDLLMYMPLGVWTFKRFLETGKFVAFSAVVAACIYTSFSIACFAMLTVYPALLFYGLFNRKKEEFLPFVAKVSLAFVCAVLAALPILVPALISYLRAGRSAGEFFGGITKGYDSGGINAETYKKYLAKGMDEKLTYILADGVLLIGTVVYFCRSKLKTGLSKFMLATGILTLIPVFVDESMLLLNMGSYMSYALRFGFLNAIYFLGGACLGVNELKFFKKEKNEGACPKRNVVIPVLYSVIFGSLFVLACVFFAGNHHISASKIFEDSSTQAAVKDFAYKFAHSQGGIFAIGIFFGCVVLILGTGCVLAVKKKLPMRLFSIFAAAIVMFQGVFYGEQLVGGNLSTQNIRFNDYQAMAQTLREIDDGFYRVRDYSNKYSANICFEGETSVFTVFSSMVDKNNLAAASMFGYSNNGQNASRGNGGVILGDCVLGYKYILVDAAKNNGQDKKTVDSKSWYDPVMVEKDGKQEHLQIERRPGVANAVYVYENDRVFPSTFVVDSGEFRFAVEDNSTAENRKRNQLAFYHYLAGSDSVKEVTGGNIETLSKKLWNNCGKISVEKNTITVDVDVQDEGKFLMVPFVALKGFEVTVNDRPAKLLDNDIKFLCVALEQGENTVCFTYQSPYGKYLLLSSLFAFVALAFVAVILTRTKLFDSCEKVVGIAGVAVAAAVLLVFFVVPIGVFLNKCFLLLIAT